VARLRGVRVLGDNDAAIHRKTEAPAGSRPSARVRINADLQALKRAVDADAPQALRGLPHDPLAGGAQVGDLFVREHGAFLADVAIVTSAFIRRYLRSLLPATFT